MSKEKFVRNKPTVILVRSVMSTTVRPLNSGYNKSIIRDRWPKSIAYDEIDKAQKKKKEYYNFNSSRRV